MKVYTVCVDNNLRLSTIDLGEAKDYKQLLKDSENVEAVVMQYDYEPTDFTKVAK